MKKIFLSLLLTLSATMLFLSCKKDPVETEEPNPNAEKIIGSWNIDADQTYVVRLYTSAAGVQKADTIPLSSQGSIVYTFDQEGVLVQTTILPDNTQSSNSFSYSVKGTDLVIGETIHIIRTLDERDLVFEKVQDQDYASGEHLKYLFHYEFRKQQ